MKKPLMHFLASIASLATCLALTPDPNPKALGDADFERYWTVSDYVIYGKVQGLQLIEGRDVGRPYKATIKVIKIFKGAAPETVTLESDLGDGGRTSWGGMWFGFSENYVIFVKSSGAASHALVYAHPLEFMPEKLSDWPGASIFGVLPTKEALIKFLLNKTPEPNQRLQTMRFKLPMNAIAQGPHV